MANTLLLHVRSLMAASLLLLTACSCEAQEPVEGQELVPTTAPGRAGITIMTVYDNYQVDPRLETAWGFGCVVMTDATNVLFDTGGSGQVLLSNMSRMGIDPDGIDTVVISHIHGDHIGGLEAFLGENADVTVHVPASFPDSWRDKITTLGARYEDVEKASCICDTTYTTGELGTTIKEQGLIIDTPKGAVLITGCAHPGILTMARRAREVAPSHRLHLVMGGFHLGGASEARLTDIIQGFRELGIEKVAPSHCSGSRCRELFQAEYAEDYVQGGAGQIISIPRAEA